MIPLTKDKINAALPKLSKAVEVYLQLQNDLQQCDVSTNRQFQKTFNGYYRVRRDAEWQKHFFGLLEKHKHTKVDFETVLVELHEATGIMEASFSSKLVGSIRPELPIIDSNVLGHLTLQLPPTGTENRTAAINQIHQTLIKEFTDFLKTDDGKYLTNRFKEVYPAGNITDVKMLDFVLWVTRKIYSVQELQEKVDNAVRDFMKYDSDLLKSEAHEQAISHRIAVYLEKSFGESEKLNVDCEYNKHLKSPKRINLDLDDLMKQKEQAKRCWCSMCQVICHGLNLEKFDDKLFRPDIVVHSRGNDNRNLIAIEIKADEMCPFDVAKLRALTVLKKNGGLYEYQLGVFLNFPNGIPNFLTVTGD
jgi:hypothetical protein